MNDSEIKTSNNPVKWITACPLAGGSRWLHRQPALTPKYGPDRLRSRPIPDNLSHGLSPNTGLILSPQFSPFPADLQKNHHWVKQMVAKSSHKLSPKLVIIPSPKLSPIPADPQKNHPMGWNKKWQNCHMNFHQIRWSYHHLNYHQFWQIPPKITIMGEIKSDKIVTRFVTKFGDIFVTLILTISGSSPKKSPYWVKQ